MEYQGDGKQLESTYRVQPGADPGRIVLSYRGMTAAHLDEQGRLVLATPVGELRESPPRAWQENADGQRVAVAVRFRSEWDADEAQALVGFTLGAVDLSRELVIDPTLEYAGYIGGIGG